MNIISTQQPLNFPTVVTIGSYDGVHYGHQHILSVVVQKSKHLGAQSLVVTMYPHPRKVLGLDASKLSLLNSLEEKAYLLERQGIDILYNIEFTPEFGNLSGEEFVEQYLVGRLNAKCVVVGYDHRFGRAGAWGFEDLCVMGQKFGFEVIQIPKQDIDQAGISSTTIRNLIASGDIVRANKYLIHPYIIIGMLQEDRSLAISESSKLLPPNGEYRVEIDDREAHLIINSDGIVLSQESKFIPNIEYTIKIMGQFNR